MVEARFVTTEQYGKFGDQAPGIVMVDRGYHIIAARVSDNHREILWETYGKGHVYYWINGNLALSLEDFLDKMMIHYPEDATWLLFHPELFQGEYFDGS